MNAHPSRHNYSPYSFPGDLAYSSKDYSAFVVFYKVPNAINHHCFD